MTWVCSWCQAEDNDAASEYCHRCAAHRDEPRPAAVPEPATERAGQTDRPGCRDCGRPLPADADACGHCGAPVRERGIQEPEIALIFPWGPVPLIVGADFVLGRADGPLSLELADYDTVGRRQARMQRTSDGLFVTDLGATNPTYVDGKPLPANEPRRLVCGQTLQLSRHLTIQIQELPQ